MKNYLLITGIEKEKLKKIREDFKFVFGVDLENEKYDDNDTIEKKWDAIVQDIFLNHTGQDKETYAKKFVELLESALCAEQDGIIRADDIRKKEKQNEILKFKKYVYDMQAVVDDYEIYEPDVWMNLYLSIQYIKAYRQGVNDEVSVGENEKNEFEKESKGYKYILPFSSYQEGFSESFREKILGDNIVQTLGADINPEEKEYVDKEENDIKFTGYRKRVNLDLGCDKKYTRWSQKKIDSLMRYSKFETEDVAMFHKIINGSFVRHMVDTMISTGQLYDVEDYIYLLEKLCMCGSINWQNLIGCLFIMISSLKRELIALDLWLDMCTMFEAWLINLDIINRRLELLVGGLVYMIYRQDSTFSYIDWVEEKCKAALKEIEKNPISFSDPIKEEIALKWKNQQDELRVYKHVEREHQQYDWVYAIMQRCVIDSLTPHKCNEQQKQERNWYDAINVLFSYSNIARQSSKSENEVEQENDQIVKNGPFKIYIVSIRDITFSLLEKVKTDEGFNKKIFYSDVLNEIKDTLYRLGIKDGCENEARKFLEILWEKYIDIKARETHGTLQLN